MMLGSTPDRNRTCNLRIRSPLLYPIELRARALRSREFDFRSAVLDSRRQYLPRYEPALERQVIGKPISNTAHGKPARPDPEFRHFGVDFAATLALGRAVSDMMIPTFGIFVIRSCAKWPLIQSEPTLYQPSFEHSGYWGCSVGEWRVFENSVLVMKPVNDSTPVDLPTADRRNEGRRPYKCRQRVAFGQWSSIPAPEAFTDVQFADLSISGGSFFLPSIPNGKVLLIELGVQPTFVYVQAEIKHITPELIKGEFVFVVGCQFTGRIA